MSPTRFPRRTVIAMLAGGVVLAACTPALGPGPFGEPMHGHAYVVRHMEKAAGDDPALTDAGHANAVLLAELLFGDPPERIFTSPTRRTRQTAAPVAAWTGVEPLEYDPRAPHVLARRIAVRPGNVLVVGHSDTVPDLVAMVGGQHPGPIADHVYGIVYRIERATGRTEAIALR